MALLLSVDYKLLKSLDYVVNEVGGSENWVTLNRIVAESIARGLTLTDDQALQYCDLCEWAHIKKLGHLKQILTECNPEGLKLVFDKPIGRDLTFAERKSFFEALKRDNFAVLTQLFRERSPRVLEHLGRNLDHQGKSVLQLTEGKAEMRAFLIEQGLIRESDAS